ncbi:hypothetical protein N8214_10760 [Pseudomonadales bacterium]|nr:hypothetical protein [Pseudomonadales bacterium]
MAQVFDSTGAASGNVINVNTTTSGNQEEPAVAGLSDGRFVVTWESNNDGSGRDIFGRIYDPQGVAEGNEFQISTENSGQQRIAKVSALENGRFVVVWHQENDADGSGQGVFGQIFDEAGAKEGGQLLINSITYQSQRTPDVSLLSDGGFVVVWQDYAVENNNWGIQGKRFDASGAAIGDQFSINTNVPPSQERPEVVGLENGGFVAVWKSYSQDVANKWTLYGRVFDASGADVGEEFRIDSAISGGDDLSGYSVAATTEGGFVVVWDQYITSGLNIHQDILGQRFDASGNKISEEFSLVENQYGSQVTPDVTVTQNGDIVAFYRDAWFQNKAELVINRIDQSLVSGNTVYGTTGNDSLSAGAGNQSLIAGLGDDTIDGGAGYNTVQVTGSADAFYWTANADGQIILSDIVVSDDDPVDGSDEGTDTLTNVQAIRYINPVTGETTVFELDDYGNSPDVGNRQIQFGEVVSGRANYYGDNDYFTMQITNSGDYHLTSYGDREFSLNIGNEYYYASRQGQTYSLTGDAELQNIAVTSNALGLDSNNPRASRGYSFTIRRILSGTNGDNELIAGSDYEYLDGGLGADVLIGSDRSDILNGGEGNDVLTGGLGNDWLEGGNGDANVAVFSGTRAEYHLEWLSGNQNLNLQVTDSVDGRDGRDTLKNVQILKFTDGELILDAEANSANFDAYLIGESITGSLPVGSLHHYQVDQDYFQQRISSDISTDSVLRIRLEILDRPASVNGGYISAVFLLMGSDDRLTFKEAGSGNNRSEFSLDVNSTAQEWFVSPDRWGSDSDFLSFAQRADVKIEGYVRDYDQVSVGELVKYSLTVDRVIMGTDADDTLAGVDGVDEGFPIGFINAQGGNDTVVGSIVNEEILGGAGDDTLSGGAGDDILRDSQGNNALKGDAGNDLIDISGASAPTAQVDGGEGTDTLRINANANWDNITVSNVEILDGNNSYSTLTVQQVLDRGFVSAQNIVFRLDQNQSDGVIDGSDLSGDLSLQGTHYSDVLIGNDDNNTINLIGTERDWVDARGVDSVSAGGGDDTITWQTRGYQWQGHFSDIDNASRTYSLTGDIDGGSGEDTLVLNFSEDSWVHNWNVWVYEPDAGDWSLDLTGLTLSGIETLNATGNVGHATKYPSNFIFTVDQLAPLDSATGLTSVIIKGGGIVDLAHLAALNITDWEIGDDLAYTFQGTASSETIEVGEGPSTVSSGEGNDFIKIDNTSSKSNVIDGGGGQDTLVISGADVDLSGVSLTSIEGIRVSSQSLAMNESQWAELASIIEVVPGAVTEFTLSLESASTMSLTEDAVYAGFSGSDEADRLIGNSADNILVGNAGNDVLEGKAGADTLVAGAGTDELYGGEGDDRLDVSNKDQVSDIVSGGAGTDTLLVSDGQNLTGATLIGLEVLSGTGTVTMSAEQVSLFKEIRGVSVQLTGDAQTYEMPPTLRLLQGAEVLLPDVDSDLVGSGGLIGSVKDDLLAGSAAADRLLGGRGADRLVGGDGNDTLIGGKGTDQHIGGAGDDTIIVGGDQFTDNNREISGELISGGEGNDTLQVEFNGISNARYVISEGLLSGIEKLVLLPDQNSGNYTNTRFTISAEAWALFTDVVSSDGNNDWENPTLDIIGSGENLNIDAISSGILNRVVLSGFFSDIDLSNPVLWDRWEDSQSRVQSSAQFTSMTLSDQGEEVYLSAGSEFTLAAGAGDDYIRHAVSGELKVLIDGGAGNDTYDVSGANFVDLSGSTLTNIETVYLGYSTLILTPTQFSEWTLDGQGSIFTIANGVITGSAAADSFSGDILDAFEGAAGDDSIYGVGTAIFSGNQADYDFTREGSTLTIQHARGTLVDGTDTLNNVLEMRFADTTFLLDDAPNDAYQFLQGNDDLYGARHRIKTEPLGKLTTCRIADHKVHVLSGFAIRISKSIVRE